MSEAAHRLVYDYVLPRVVGDERVLDLGAGAAPLAGWLSAKGCKVVAADIDGDKLKKARKESGQEYQLCVDDMARGKWESFTDSLFDLVIAKYSIQHMLGRQCFAWSEVARVLRQGGRFIHAGRYRRDAPVYEMDRQDPLLAHNEKTIEALAYNCGLQVADIKLFYYNADRYCEEVPELANQMIAMMVKP